MSTSLGPRLPPPSSPIPCWTRTGSPRPVACSSRCPATPRSTGSPPWPPGIVDAGHAKVTLFTDQDTVVGGFGLPPGVIGGPGLLTGALSAIVVRQGAPLSVADAAAEERVADLPAVTSGQVRAYLGSPLVAASGHVVGALAVYDPEPRNWTDDETELLRQLAASVVAELELSAARSAVGTSVTRLNVALEASSIGTWERDLRTGAIDWDERCAALFGLDGATQFETEGSMESRFVHPDDAGRAAGRHAAGDGGARPVHRRVPRADGRRVRALDGRPRPAGHRLPRRAGAPARHDPRRHRGPSAGRTAAVGHAAGDGDRRGGRRAGQCRADGGPARDRAARRPGARCQSSALAVFDPTTGRCGCT